MSKLGITRSEKRTVWIHLNSYTSHSDFSAEEWLTANTAVRESGRLKEYVKSIKKYK